MPLSSSETPIACHIAPTCDARIHAEHCPWPLWQGYFAGFTRNQEQAGCLSGDPGLPEPFSTDTAGSLRSPGKVPVCKHCQGPNFSGKHSQMVQEKHSDGVRQHLTSHSACMLTALKKLHTRYPHEGGGVWPGGTLLQLSSNKPRECTC